MKQSFMLHTPLVLGIALLTTMVLLFGNTAFHPPGTVLTTVAYAAAGTTRGSNIATHPQTPCASTPTEEHCTGQDPMGEQCYRDAQTLSFIRIQDTQGRLLAIVQRRYSGTCHSEWGRIIAWGQEPVSIRIGTNTEVPSAGPIAFTTMEFVPDLEHVSEITGKISINGITPDQSGSTALVAMLPALPASTAQ
jgi:hypothetical protein